MNEYITWLETRADQLHRQRAEYAATDRKDDSDLTAIRINILGVCKSIRETFIRVQKSDDEYLAKLNELATSWNMAREAALAHDDTEQAAIESIKLETLGEVIDKFQLTRRFYK